MRDRQRILDNLEKLYRDELDRGPQTEGSDAGRLDFEFQRDQLYLEVLLDLRDLFSASPEERLRSGPHPEQTDLPQHRLLDLLLVPRDGARKFRG